MASLPAETASETLKYQTWVLKVSVHCEGCKREVKKILQRIEGVYTVAIDAQQQKVTVTGNIGVDTLLKKLKKAGKHGELWPGKLEKAEKKAGKIEKEKEKGSKGGKNFSSVDQQEKAEVNYSKEGKAAKSGAGKAPENTPGGEADKKVSESGVGAGESGAKKKKKGQKEKDGDGPGRGQGQGQASEPNPLGNGFQLNGPGLGLGQGFGPSNFSPYPQEFSFPHPVHAMSYNTAYPNCRNPAPFYCVPPYLYMYGNGGQGFYPVPEKPSVSFDIFSDENANGCFIM